MLKPVDPALFLSESVGRSVRIDLAPACPSSPPRGASFRIAPPRVLRPCVQRPNATTSQAACAAHFRTPFGARHFASRTPRTEGRQALAPLPQPAGGVISSGALLGATGGTQTHSRRTGSKLGRLRCARQGLVRVPESNTKYGGYGGITGVYAAPVMGPSISESSGIPKQKNCPHGCEFPPAPAVHRPSYFFSSRH